MLNARDALFASTAMTPAPGPVIVRLRFIGISPVVNRIVPARPAWKLIVSPGEALRTVSRSEPGPASPRLVTVSGAALTGVGVVTGRNDATRKTATRRRRGQRATRGKAALFS